MQCGMGNDCHERRRLNELNAAILRFLADCHDHYGASGSVFWGADTDPHKELED